MEDKFSIIVKKTGLKKSSTLILDKKTIKIEQAKLRKKQKQERKEKIKALNRKRNSILKKFVATSLASVPILGLSIMGLRSGTYFYAENNNLLDFTERTYEVNTNVEPGYYNENPLQVCISKEFSKPVQHKIANAIEYLDKNAKGITFEYFYGEPTKENCDILIKKSDDFQNSHIVGLGTLNSLDCKNIKGNITLKEDLDTYFTIKAITVHELCHVLGLNHSKDLDSIMYPTVSTLSMSKEDINNINTLYPEK